MRFKVIFTESYLTEEGRHYLESNNCEVGVKSLRWEPEEELIDALRDADAVIAGGEKYSERVLMAAKKLKVIARLGTGTDAIDLAAATLAGITITNTPGANSPAVAEMTLGLMLSLCRQIPQLDSSMKKGIWKQPVATELSSSTVGIVGMGCIGHEVIKRLKPFGSRIVVFDVVRDSDFAEKWGVEYVSLEHLMEISDIVSIHVPLRDDTRGLINADLLRRMKPTAYLVNTSRGPVVEREALMHALEKKLIAGAALDVHWREPCEPNDPLVIMENVIATPHVGYNTREAQARMVKAAAEDVVAVLNGRPPRFPVNVK
ncbi:MAG: phosphoglycerate dehydrogenase [Firmicutes bacterium]|nr:phosphoglycerate dehydrogenase [Bacillota bacterium]